jgi:hypothetical protein
MIHIGEPVLKPFLIAMALIYVVLISQPVWAMQVGNPAVIAQHEHVIHVEFYATKPGDS